MRESIIVIGGGVAGLTAALDLAKSGFSVTLLEARSRLGGRIYTTFANDDITPIELGASYWEGMNTSSFYQQYFSLTHPGKVQTKRLNEMLSVLISIDTNQKLNNMIEYYHVAQQVLIDSEQLGRGKSFEEYIKNINLSNYSFEQRYWINRFLENSLQHHCTPLSQGGFPTFKRDNISADDLWNDEDADFCFVQNGFDKVIQQLHTECLSFGVKCLLSCPVNQITDHGDNGVEIEANHQRFQAHKIISTIPIGVLKTQMNHLFKPSLSKEKQQAINMIGVHDATRVILEFEKPFWDNLLGPYIYLDFKNSPCLLEYRNTYPLNGKAILLTGKYSDIARKFYDAYPHDYAFAEQKLVNKALYDLQKAFPKPIPLPIKTIVYCWTHDPFAKGAYPYRKASMTEEIQLALERSEGNIYFAGADFSRFGFSVHHAYNNAKQIAALIKNQ